MVSADGDYIRGLLAREVVRGPVLELGTGWGGTTCRDLVKQAGLDHYGTDLKPGPGVDFVVNFEQDQDLAVFRPVLPFGSVFVLNVLEHTFEPLRVLDNARTLLRPGGTLVVITPAVWPLHDYPMDAWRLLPNVYEQYARRRGLRLLVEHFEYVGKGPVAAHRNVDGTYRFPPPCVPAWRCWYGRLVHKLFRTHGRSMFQPSHVAVGAVFVVPG